MTALVFHPEAGAELAAAAQYYEEQAEHLGTDFVSAIERTCARLSSFPESGHPFGSRLRRMLVPGFPYGVVYRAESDLI